LVGLPETSDVKKVHLRRPVTKEELRNGISPKNHTAKHKKETTQKKEKNGLCKKAMVSWEGVSGGNESYQKLRPTYYVCREDPLASAY